MHILEPWTTNLNTVVLVLQSYAFVSSPIA